MTGILSDPADDARRTARRLCRLFRIERAGGFDHRPVATARRIIARRDGLIAALIAFPRQHGQAPSATLVEELARLADEVSRARAHAEARIERLRAELGSRRGDRGPTGLRGGADGRLLGRG